MTVTEARDYLRLDGTDNDGVITPLLSAIPDYIETTTGMSAAQQATEPLADTVSKFLLALWYNAEGTETEKLERTINSLLKVLTAMAVAPTE
ncbi:head-tail connector protein [Acetobacterium carbinolicum]|uniref:head-tail connector protein n=1 Tax=Acetobacterium carbinolicum TaxID=52690 RepID=UPI0039BF7BE7